jgi:hypothetical protein
MPTSQFTYYTSNDAGAPVLNGTSGSLINVLNGILVTGYGSKVAAGWTADFTSSLSSGSTYRPASGSRMYLHVVDWAQTDSTVMGPQGAKVCGTEIATAVFSGSGFFPRTSQTSINSGNTQYLTMCKSNATVNTINDTILRPWFCYADAWTMYFFAVPGFLDVAGTLPYLEPIIFGDLFSLKRASDAYQTIFIAKDTLSNSSFANWDSIGYVGYQTIAGFGHFMPRGWGGGGYSIVCGKTADMGMIAFQTTYTTVVQCDGMCQYPNGPDGSIFVHPIYVYDHYQPHLRGRLRGVYQVGHSRLNFQNGDTFSGSGDYSGKVFQIVMPSRNDGFWAIEISPTVETN